MSHVITVCESCGNEYSYDSEAAPDYCCLFCSSGCAKMGGWTQ